MGSALEAEALPTAIPPRVPRPSAASAVHIVLHLEEFRFILSTFDAAGVVYTINTDGTYLCDTNLHREFRLLEESEILDGKQVEVARQRAFDASFIAAD